MSWIVVVDETKANGYVMVAASVPTEQAAALRRAISDLRMPGQRSLHMRSEGSRRRTIVRDTVVALARDHRLQVVVYDAGQRGSERDRRSLCLWAIVRDQIGRTELRLVLDRDDMQESSDRQALIESVRDVGMAGALIYEHRDRHEEPLLAIADTFAWSWNRGGAWRRSIRPYIGSIRNLRG